VPELPEVETIARGVDRAVAGARIVGAGVPRPDVLRVVTKPATFVRRVKGGSILGAVRRAKHIVITLDDGDALVIQPRFTGGIIVKPPAELTEEDTRYACIQLDLDDGRQLIYRDVRRLGTVALMNSGELEAYFGELGVEPLSPAFTPERLSGILRASRQPVKKVIMDQYRLVGVGNIYANEALWRARIDPSRAASRVTPDEARVLRDEIVTILNEAIEAGGSTIRDFYGAQGERGEFASRHNAYGHGGEPCARCGATLVETHAIDGRQTVLCVRCQR
jgi:formamidopyrimidine-DNA glycosylase